MANVQFSHHKFNNNSSPVYNIGNTTTTQWNGSEIIGKKSYHQQTTTTNNSMRLDNASSYNCQAQLNNQNSNNFFPTSKHVKHVINSYPSQSQKRKKNLKPSSLSSSLSTSNSFHNLQDFSSRQFNNRSKSNLQQKTFISSSIPSKHEVSDIISTTSQISYAPKIEVPAGLPQTLFASRQGDCDFQSTSSSSQQSQQHNSLSFTHEQSQIRRLSFESSGGCCCKSLPTKSEGSEISEALQFFVIKLPGMKNFILVPKCTVEKNDHDDEVRVFSPTTKMHVDQSITVKLPGMSNNSVFLCEEPWWLSPKETTDITTVPSNEEGDEGNDDDVNDDDDDDNNNNIDQGYDHVDDVEEEEEYESARAIEIQFDVTPIVKLPSLDNLTSIAVKLDHIKEVEYLNDYCHITTSDSLEFDKESPVVRLHPKSTPNTRCNLPNLKIETNLKLDKDDDDRFPSADCSTLSTPISEVSSTSFSNMSYAESDNTVFTEEEIINESKSCNAPERRSPSVLSDFSSEYLTPVLEEEEEEESKMVSSTSPVEECQQEMTVEEFSDSNENIHSPIESENEDLEEYQETQDLEDPQEDNEQVEYDEQVEYALPELREIAEQLEKLQPDSIEAIGIRRQLEIINRDNYPDSLPLSNKWTMYFADTSVTKINTRVISKNKYSSTLNPIFECTTVPELCSNLREFSSKIKPSDMKTNVNLSFFKGNIMPMWEDEANHKGGRFTLCPPRSQLNSLWNSIVLLLAGETIDDNNFICGAVCARRDRGDRVELWISGDAHSKGIDRIRDLLADELGYDTVRNVKYKKHLGRP